LLAPPVCSGQGSQACSGFPFRAITPVAHMKTFSRRKILRCCCQAGALTLLQHGTAAWAQTALLHSVQLGTDLFLIQGPDANVLLVRSDEGLVLVDGGHASWAADALALAATLADSRAFRALINTHWHPEQVGANPLLGAAGAEIIAHDNTRLWLGTDIEQRWSGQVFEALPEAGRPKTAVFDESERQFGAHTVQMGYLLHAHTDGDLYVHLPAQNVLFAGGFLASDGWPLIDWWTGGWSGGMLNAFDSLLPLCDEDTLIIPASGAPLTLADFKAQREMYQVILEKVHAAFVKSLGPDETVASQPAAGFKPEWGSADQFVKLAAESLQGQLRGGVGGWLPRIP